MYFARLCIIIRPCLEYVHPYPVIDGFSYQIDDASNPDLGGVFIQIFSTFCNQWSSVFSAGSRLSYHPLFAFRDEFGNQIEQRSKAVGDYLCQTSFPLQVIKILCLAYL